MLPVLSIADVEIQKTRRADNSHGRRKPHDYYKRKGDHHEFQISDRVVPGWFI